MSSDRHWVVWKPGVPNQYFAGCGLAFSSRVEGALCFASEREAEIIAERFEMRVLARQGAHRED